MSAITLTPEKNVDIYVRYGASINRVLNVIDKASGAAFDFTGYTVTLEVYTSEVDKTPNLVFNSDDGILDVAGKISLVKPFSIWTPKLRRRSYVYFLWVTDPAANKELWMNGRFIVQDSVSSQQNITSNIEVNTANSVLTIEVNAAGGTGNDTGGFSSTDLEGNDVLIENGGDIRFYNTRSFIVEGFGVLAPAHYHTFGLYDNSLMYEGHTSNINPEGGVSFNHFNDDTGGYSIFGMSIYRLFMAWKYDNTQPEVTMQIGPCNGLARPGLIITGLPTSPDGLISGTVWRDPAANNVLKIVP
jgi:hypothetical protein